MFCPTKNISRSVLISCFADKPTIKDIAAYAKDCFIGILRVPTHHLFGKAIAVMRKFKIVQYRSVTVADHITLAKVARDLSEKDVARLASSMLEQYFYPGFTW